MMKAQCHCLMLFISSPSNLQPVPPSISPLSYISLHLCVVQAAHLLLGSHCKTHARVVVHKHGTGHSLVFLADVLADSKWANLRVPAAAGDMGFLIGEQVQGFLRASLDCLRTGSFVRTCWSGGKTSRDFTHVSASSSLRTVRLDFTNTLILLIIPVLSSGVQQLLQSQVLDR